MIIIAATLPMLSNYNIIISSTYQNLNQIYILVLVSEFAEFLIKTCLPCCNPYEHWFRDSLPSHILSGTKMNTNVGATTHIHELNEKSKTVRMFTISDFVRTIRKTPVLVGFFLCASVSLPGWLM